MDGGNLDSHDTFDHVRSMDFVFPATFGFLDGVSNGGPDGTVEDPGFAEKNLFAVSTIRDAMIDRSFDVTFVSDSSL